MPILNADMVHKVTANMPINDTNPSGGAMGTGTISGLSVGEAWPTFVYGASGGSTIVWYYATAISNQHGSLTAQSPVYFGENFIQDFVASGAVSIQSQDAADDSSKTARVYGEDASTGNQISSDRALSALATVSTGAAFAINKVDKIELIDSVSGALVAAAADLLLTRGVSIGKIPKNYDFATRELRIALATDGAATPAVAVNTNEQTANRLTAPVKITAWSRANTAVSGIAGVDIPAGSYQVVWWEITGRAGVKPTSQNRGILGVEMVTPA